jgi:RNA 3'-terminal phosphate cyclase (ATP)
MTGHLTAVEIDGSQGEGGGQVLRSALALSIITGKPFHIFNIRIRRSQTGLKAQHLRAVDAAASVSKAQVDGAALNSTELTFQPIEIRSGRYKWEIGTAGATTLVLQTIFLPLSLATSASTAILTGGTHVPWSPCYHYIELHWLPYLKQIGFDAQFSLEQSGFYPQGGGRMTATIRPAAPIVPLNLTRRGELLHISGYSAVANLPLSIAERQKRQALGRLLKLPWDRTPEIHLKILQLPSPVKGTFLLLLAEFDGGRCCTYSLGALGKPAERVADEAVDALLAFLDTGAAIDQYLADQLLLPLCLACDPSSLHVSQITQHMLTNAEIVRQFLPHRIEIHGSLSQPGFLHIAPII